MKGGLMGQRRTTRVNGTTVTVQVIEIEQRLGRNRGKWVCVNEATGRRLHRTDRQLHPLPVEKAEAGAWDEAVRIVDARHGYTVEFAADPDAHRGEYAEEAERLNADTGFATPRLPEGS